MKKIIISLLIVSSMVYGRKIVVKLATLAPEGTDWHGMLVEMGQDWKKITKGKVEVRVYPGGVIGDERDMVRKIRIGQIHAAGMSTEGLSEIVPDFKAFYVPMAYQDLNDVERVLDDLLPSLDQQLSDKGFKLLYLGDLGFAYWFSSSPVVSPKDLKGKKIFTWAGDFQWAEIYKKAGYNPVPLASTDILSGLQTGLIDALSTMPMYALAQQSFGIANHMLDLKWGVLLAGIIVDNKTWNKIPKKFHKDLLESAERIRLKHLNKNRQADQQAIEAMKQYGLIIHTPSKENINEWNLEVKKMENHLKGNVIPEKVYDRVIELTQD